ncbi:hypothetical protein D8M04_00460 [Oceanobacillus piezotolerans]|uniref:Uncharacterized protein n=1 Tax=Oceanobacillus piezotolerans TaxID=2448030 RepID=A0A498DS28_9BACI|nr:hypothetical protein D8M04_00460 [Oceanobacillus piezotolerans]
MPVESGVFCRSGFIHTQLLEQARVGSGNTIFTTSDFLTTMKGKNTPPNTFFHKQIKWIGLNYMVN